MIKQLSSLAVVFCVSQTLAQTQTYLEDFQSGIPGTYTIVDNDGLTPDSQVAEYTEAWISTQDPDDGSNWVAGSTSYFDPEGTADRWLITPPLSLSSFGNYISWQAKSHDPSYPDGYLVLVSTTDTQITSFTDTIGDIQSEIEFWTYRETNLDEFANQTIHVAFVNNTFDGFKLYLDSIALRIDDPVGIDEKESEFFSCYPNPATDKIFINSSLNLNSIKIYSSRGELVMETSEKTIDLLNFPSGIYMIQAISEERVFTTKIFKTN